MARIKVGSLEVISIQDMKVAFLPTGMFPNAPADGWAVYRPIYPAGFDGDNLSLSIGTFVIAGSGRTILVDTGLGPNVNPDNPGKLVENLEAEGVQAADVDTVVFTHLHGDHVGWNFQDGQVTFPRARYVVQQADWDFFKAQKDDATVQAQVLPLEGTGCWRKTEAAPASATSPWPGFGLILRQEGRRVFRAL